ncbi:MAG TPA: HD domain-containing phosphohydrolase [Solirubrobacteraceae bacterium]|nr:HD domain-containing phosphohydrolase [Solirubrobacteraceae bacterium]
MPDSTLEPLPSPGDPGALARLRGLLEAASAVRAAGDLQPLLERIARVISVSLGFGTVVVNLHRPAWDDFEVVVVHGGDEEARRTLLGTTQNWDGWQPLLDARFERSGAYFIPHDEYDWDRHAPVSYVPPGGAPAEPGDWHPEDALFVPLRSSTGRLLGIVSVDEPVDGRRPSDAQLEVLSAVAGHAALAIEHAQAAADGAANRSAVQHLLRVSARLTTRRSVEEMLFAVCEGVRDALGFQRVIVALTESPDHRLVTRASIGWNKEELAALPPVPLAAISRLLRPEHQREGCVLLARHEAVGLTPPELHDLHRGELNGRGPQAWNRHWLIVPLHDRDGAFTGIVWVDEPEDRLLPTIERLQALRAFANQAISAVESTRQLEHLRHLAEHDPLTGLRNRRGLEPRIAGEIADAGPSGAVSVLVCDIDDFRRVNETLGPEGGDDVLRRFADVLRRLTRATSDVPTRLGGEEFAVVLRDTDRAGALGVAERLRVAVREEFRDLPVEIAVSIGLAASGTELSTADDLLRAANRALHAAKRIGRDRSVRYHPAVGLLDGLRTETSGGSDQLAAAILLAETLDLRDVGTARHSETVGLLAEQTARRLGWSSERVKRLRAAGALHDIGKLGIPDAILHKPGSLDEEEWREIRRHPEIGALILEHANLPDIARWVRAHHERIDGGGYPDGLAGAAIPPEARILAAADAYEAMTADRPYRRSLPPHEAEDELRRAAGTQFDGEVVDALLAALADGDEGVPSPV